MSTFEMYGLGAYALAVAIKILAPQNSQNKLAQLLIAEADLVQKCVHLPDLDLHLKADPTPAPPPVAEAKPFKASEEMRMETGKPASVAVTNPEHVEVFA